jgi:hypothetical protein
MARERVQVQGLGDVAPGIQPTIQRAGQYGIQVQRAGRNKLMDLADALSQVNPTLQQYIGVAEQEAEMFEEELARKSPEEVQAMLKQTEGELDKQVRRGTMGWLTSPLNQKRKMQAVGALLHDDYERQLKAQVEDPANADADINELIAGVKDNLRSQYGSLQSAFVNEGFEGAIRETTRRYTLAHDSLSEAVSREQLELAGKNIAYRASLDNEEGKMADPDAISRWWSENEGAFTPAQLLKLRRDVAMAHARANDRESFEHWMEFSGKLKVGTTTIKDKRIKEDDVFSDYSSDEAVLRADAENMFRQQQNKELQDGNNILRELTNEGVEISAKLANNQSYTSEDGTVINNEEEAFQYLRQKAVDTRNSFVAGPDAVDRIYQSLDAIRKPKPKEEVFLQFKRIFTEVSASAGQNFEETAQDTATMLLSESDNLLVDPTDPTGAARLNPRYQAIAGNILRDIMGERIKTMRQLSSGKYKTVEGESVESTKYQTIVADHMLEYDQDFLSKFETRLKDAIGEDRKQEATKAVVTAKPEQYVEGQSTSFIDPSKVVSKEAAMLDTNVFNVEMQLREGNLEKAFKEASNLEDASIPYFEREKPNQYTTGYEIPTIRFKSKIDQLVETIESTSKLKEEKETAKKGLSVYMLAKNLFSAENIKQGFVTVKTFKGDREIPVDKEAIKELLPLYPLLSRERLLALQADPNADKTPEKEYYEAIFEETLDDNSKEDQDKVDLFITQQMEAAARF